MIQPISPGKELRRKAGAQSRLAHPTGIAFEVLQRLYASSRP
jgi:hypothetical protein